MEMYILSSKKSHIKKDIASRFLQKHSPYPEVFVPPIPPKERNYVHTPNQAFLRRPALTDFRPNPISRANDERFSA